MADCSQYGDTIDLRGENDSQCPNDWPVIKLVAGVIQPFVVTLGDSILTTTYPMITGDVPPPDPPENYCFTVDGQCLPEGLALRFRDHWDSSNIAILLGERTSDTTFSFTPTADIMKCPGLFLADLVLYRRNTDDEQTAVWLKRAFLEIEPNSLNTDYKALSIAELRLALRDECPAANFLLDDYEYTNKEIFAAMRRAVDYWNEQPPYIRPYTYDNFPFRHHWIIGAIGLLLRQVGRHKLRNYMNVSSGGTNVDDQGRWRDYHALGDQYWSEYREWVRLKKIEINLNLGWGSI